MMPPPTLAPMSIGSPSKQTRTLLSATSARRSDDDKLSSPSAAVGSQGATSPAADDAAHFKISAGDAAAVAVAGAHSQAYDLASPSNIMTP